MSLTIDCTSIFGQADEQEETEEEEERRRDEDEADGLAETRMLFGVILA